MPKRILNGTVVSCKNTKSVVVEVARKVKHKLYKKIIKSNKRFHAHDENNSCKVGDSVSIQESKPISKLKRWIVLYNLDEGKKQ